MTDAIQKSDLAGWWFPEMGKIDPEILDRRKHVARMWNREGLSCRETARRLDVSAQTISKDRQWLLECWQKATQADVIEVVARELQKLEEQEVELWEAWERSKEDAAQVTTERNVGNDGNPIGGAVVKTRTSGRLPDPKYMDLILRCQERRARLLGLDKQVTFEGANFSFAMFVEEAYANNQRQQKLIDVTPPAPLPGE